jgi:hypothetical protein
MPSSAASALSARLCGGSILRSTASLRSSEYLGTVLSSSPLVVVLQSYKVEATTSLTQGANTCSRLATSGTLSAQTSSSIS